MPNVFSIPFEAVRRMEDFKKVPVRPTLSDFCSPNVFPSEGSTLTLHLDRYLIRLKMSFVPPAISSFSGHHVSSA